MQYNAGMDLTAEELGPLLSYVPCSWSSVRLPQGYLDFLP